MTPAAMPSPELAIEDPTNLRLFDPAAVAILPAAIRLGISANLVSLTGLATGGLAAIAYARWAEHPWALVGLLLSMIWLVTDSLDGKIARATNTASAFGRELDGFCDYGVFIMIYAAIAGSIGGRQTWLLAFAAGVVHALQAGVYEAERARFYRRMRGGMHVEPPASTRNPFVRFHDAVIGVFSAAAARFDRVATRSARPDAAGAAYGAGAAPILRMMVPLTQNSRVFVIFATCLCRMPALFWWIEIVPFTALMLVGLARLRYVERTVLQRSQREPLGAKSEYSRADRA